jgi:hypothetical protein
MTEPERLALECLDELDREMSAAQIGQYVLARVSAPARSCATTGANVAKSLHRRGLVSRRQRQPKLYGYRINDAGRAVRAAERREAS